LKSLPFVREMLPDVPALKNEFPPPVAVKVDEPNWLIEPPVEVTSKRLAVAVGRTTLPAVAMKTAGPPDAPVETEPPAVELIAVPWIVTLLPVIAPVSNMVPAVVRLITDPPTRDKTGARLAEAPPPPPKTIFGAVVKPLPPDVKLMELTAPLAIAAVPAAPVPPPPAKVTVGTLT